MRNGTKGWAATIVLALLICGLFSCQTSESLCRTGVEAECRG